MGVVDRDGLDGLIRVPGELTSLAVVPVVSSSSLRQRLDSVSGLQALAEHARPDPPVDAMMASWTSLEPLAEIPRSREVEATLFDEPRAARPARPTVQPPVRAPLSNARIVLSFMLGGAALAAAITLTILRAFAPGLAPVTPPPALGLATTAAPAPQASAAALAPAPVPAATIDRQVLRRPPALPPAPVASTSRLEWRLPASFTPGGAVPRAVDAQAMSALVAALNSHCRPGTVVVTGHTCTLGTRLLNLVMGKRRALSARALLVADGLAVDGVRVASAAASRPEASNATRAGRQRNRRVTIACQPLQDDVRGEE
jgi:outer membrane protein OmpA-like peptidoglycan-associated protein